MEILFVSFLLFALGYVARDIFGNGTGYGDREEREQPALPPPTERVPMLPPSAARNHANKPVQYGDGPYRTQDEIEPKPPRLPAHSFISFQNFFRYCQVNGIPECPADNVEFVTLARDVDFVGPKQLASLLTKEIQSRLKRDEDEPELVERLAVSQALIHAVAVRNQPEDADLIVSALKCTSWSEARYVMLRAIGGVWPVSAAAILTVAKMQDYRHKNAPKSDEFISGAAKEIISRWRERDPDGYRELSRQLLYND